MREYRTRTSPPPPPPAVCPQPALRTGGGNASRADPGGLGSGSDTNWPIAKRGLQPARRPSAPGLSASARSPCSHKALLWACWNVSACVLWPQHTDARSRCQALGRAPGELPGGARRVPLRGLGDPLPTPPRASPAPCPSPAPLPRPLPSWPQVGRGLSRTHPCLLARVPTTPSPPSSLPAVLRRCGGGQAPERQDAESQP